MKHYNMKGNGKIRKRKTTVSRTQKMTNKEKKRTAQKNKGAEKRRKKQDQKRKIRKVKIKYTFCAGEVFGDLGSSIFGGSAILGSSAHCRERFTCVVRSRWIRFFLSHFIFSLQ